MDIKIKETTMYVCVTAQINLIKLSFQKTFRAMCLRRVEHLYTKKSLRFKFDLFSFIVIVLYLIL